MPTKEGERLRKSGGLSYSRLRELLLEKISQLGMDPQLFGMHSLRAGGAMAAANAGVPDHLFKRHSRWRSRSAKDGYVKDSVDQRLSVRDITGLLCLCMPMLGVVLLNLRANRCWHQSDGH